jgi:hypothetical protein
MGSRHTAEQAGTRLTAVAGWAGGGGPSPWFYAPEGERAYREEDVEVRANAATVLRTSTAKANPLTAPTELTAKSAQSACRPGEKV